MYDAESVVQNLEGIKGRLERAMLRHEPRSNTRRDLEEIRNDLQQNINEMLGRNDFTRVDKGAKPTQEDTDNV